MSDVSKSFTRSKSLNCVSKDGAALLIDSFNL